MGEGPDVDMSQVVVLHNLSERSSGESQSTSCMNPIILDPDPMHKPRNKAKSQSHPNPTSPRALNFPQLPAPGPRAPGRDPAMGPTRITRGSTGLRDVLSWGLVEPS